MLSKKCWWPIILIGSTTLFAMNDDKAVLPTIIAKLNNEIKVSTEASTFAVECRFAKQMEFYFDQATSETLVFFDLNGTIRDPTDKALQMKTMKKYRAIVQESLGKLTEEGIAFFGGAFVIETKPMLVDPDFPQAIEKMQKRGVRVAALSSSTVGYLGEQKIEEKQYQEIKELGINFSTNFPEQNIIFHQLTPLLGNYPIFYKGMALTNREKNSKGDLALALIEALNWQPKNVLFVDDSKVDIEDVTKKLKGKNISCQAILFTGAYEKHEDISKENFAESWNAILKKAEIFANEAGIKFWR